MIILRRVEGEHDSHWWRRVNESDLKEGDIVTVDGEDRAVWLVDGVKVYYKVKMGGLLVRDINKIHFHEGNDMRQSGPITICKL